MLLVSPLYDADFSAVADFPSDFGNPDAVDIHDVSIVPLLLS
jgi:hypothetical protein